MNMRQYILISFIAGIFLTSGCEKFTVGNDFLEKAPGVDVTQDTVFSTLEYAERFLWNAYYWLPYGLDYEENGLGEKMSHELLQDITDLSHSKMGWGGATGSYYSGTYTSSSENGSSSSKYSLGREAPYTGIRKAYIFIENIDQVPDVDPAYRSQLKAEARMIIAVLYSEILRHFGGVPWVNKSFDINDNMSSLPRLTAQATCDSIVALCDKAAVDLPLVLSNITTWDGRFTKAGAMGLKARILLFNASPLFNDNEPYLDGEASQKNLVWHGNYDVNLWKEAADAAHELIALIESSGSYRLYHAAGNTLRKDFQEGYLKRGNGEILISTRKLFRAATGYTFYTASYSWGAGCPTQEVVDMFPMANGAPILAAGSGYNPLNPYANRDPRLYETVLTNGDAFQGRTAELWIGGRERTAESGTQAATGYIVRKFMLDHNSSTSIGGIVQWPYLRLPEIYLSYAEADNEFNGGPSAEAYRCVNIVRSRVGLGNLPPGLTQEQFREAILTERVCEFAVEEIRWFDLVRWKRAADFQKQLHGMKTTRSVSTPYTYTYQLFDLPTRYWQINWSPKWYLSAWPLNEMQKQYGLIQNPGWE